MNIFNRFEYITGKVLAEKIYDFGVFAQSWSKFDLFCICFVGGGILYVVAKIMEAVCHF
jgi:hypothetical protein